MASAPLKNLIIEKLPKDTRIHTGSKDLIIKLSQHFLNTLSARANDICNNRNKKTVCADHVIDALFVSSFLTSMQNGSVCRR